MTTTNNNLSSLLGISLIHTSCEAELWNEVEELTFEVVYSSERDHDMTFVNHHNSKENQLKSYLTTNHIQQLLQIRPNFP